MQRTTMITSACAGLILTLASIAPARAQTMDARTEFTFNRSVELPGVTLPPGTYVFRIADTTGSRNVMQVQAKDSSQKPYGLFMTISAQRPSASDNAELRFLETPAGQPAAVKTWWYPGRTIGREFIYPKSQARRLAKATNQPVLTTQDDKVSNDAMSSTDLAYVSPNGQDTPLTDEQLVDVAANTPPVGVPARSNATQEGTMARTNLPRTSTPLAGIALMGLVSLLGGAALRLRG